ncbi:MAG TPA: TraR/DksA family transcriptional regulator [Ktedonobacteraceae bacterium]
MTTMVSDLNNLRARLESRHRELQEAIAQLQPLYASESSTAGPSEGVQDSAERAREAEEQEEKQSLFAHQRTLLDEIEQALRRLDRGTYGRCSTCGRPIPARRLQAIPWATRDVECAERAEQARS